MSQQLTPVNGGVIPQIETTTAQTRLNVLSPQYIEVNNLESRPTEWVPGGRPIYRRLPATGEAYQINFFNLVTESNITGNTFVGENVEEVGYVFVPYGQSINGPSSVEVVASDNDQNLLIKAGVLIWKYGKSEVLPTIVNLNVLDVGSGSYDIAYQLIYDDSPVPMLYEATDFSLSGQPLNITSSTDSVIGWRYSAVNAFINAENSFWSNEDTYFPSYAQPSSAYLQWESELTQAYKKVVLRCPPGTAYTAAATLFYVNNSVLSEVGTVTVSSDSTGQYYEFDVVEPVLQGGWRVDFSETTISIESITVSGVLTLLEPQATVSPRSRLVMYPVGTLPPFVEDGEGNKIPTVYCRLAEVDVSNNYRVLRISDQRTIIHRDYTPVADWLTTPFDQDLINLYEQVSEYPKLWMAPPSCMKQEYANLTSDQIVVEA